MRLSMNSYNVDDYYHTVLGKTRTKNININRVNLNEVIHLLNTFIPKNIHQISFMKKLRTAVKYLIENPKSQRIVEDNGPFFIDKFLELDSLGIEKYSNTYTAFVSTSDCLDLALNQICGADIESIRNIKNYKLLSRALTSGDYDLMSKLSFESLLNVDDKLDDFLISYYVASEDKYAFLNTVIRMISSATQTILDDTMSRFRTFYNNSHPQNIVLRAMSSSKLILGAEEPFEHEIKVADNYYLKIRTYEQFEFINYVQEPYCLYEGGVEDDPLWDN